MKAATLLALLPLALAAPVADSPAAARAYGSYLYDDDTGKDLPAYTDYGAYDGAGDAAKYTDYGSYAGAGTDDNPNGIPAYNSYGRYTGVGEDAPKGENAPAWWSAYAKPPQGWGDYGKYKWGRRARQAQEVKAAEGEE
ncbi:hypothetical protein QBC34DRAFT_431906 [Podospora aff. communis PSN243]|uniref:Uncharacterized protein n=1 Tax=Podospora aff. communis PSN243 TaxID=3040156 RepID=A0AAV9G3U2_9PEZI|nr:hypothetical protein QBC34DRAFT_431906 [Podospora aff. communis PSN243]